MLFRNPGIPLALPLQTDGVNQPPGRQLGTPARQGVRHECRIVFKKMHHLHLGNDGVLEETAGVADLRGIGEFFRPHGLHRRRNFFRRRRHLVAENGRKFLIGDARFEHLRKRERHGKHHPIRFFRLKDTRTVPIVTVVCRQHAHITRRRIKALDFRNPFGDLKPVGTDILHGGSPDRSRHRHQIFNTAKSFVD